MGRRPRVLLAGGIYHVYNRVSRGQHVFRDDGEAERLEDLLAATKKRDDFQILAWCIMSNHYHLAVRMGEVSLSRSMRYVQHRYAQSYNGRHRVFGPLWQGRYRSRMVGDEEYLRQLIAYIHLNPVTAGVVEDAAKHRWCGHREVIGRGSGRRLVDVEETLLAFAPDRRRALGGYRAAMRACLEEDWRGQEPGRLPWWRAGRPPKKDEGGEITVDEARPRIGMDGLSNAPPRPRIELEEFVARVAHALGFEVEDLRSRRRQTSIVEAREVLVWLGVELYGLTVKELAEVLDKHLETASRMVSRAGRRRVVDESFRAKIQQVDSMIAGTSKEAR